MKIDAAVHFWKYEKTILNPLIRNNKLMQQHYLPEQITQSLQRNGIDGCIAVVAEKAEVETRFLCELGETHPQIRAVAGWTDLLDPRAVEKIESFRSYGLIRSYQFDIGDQFPKEELMQCLLENEYGLDISIGSKTDPLVLGKWISDNPEQTFILQNSGTPDTKEPPSKSWENMISELSKNRNLFCKVSGLLENSHLKSWKPADIYPFLDILFRSFGMDRLLFASNWPFILSAGLYVQWKSLLEKYTEKFVDEERDAFFGENAELIYRL